jgi:hypothetical protein
MELKRYKRTVILAVVFFCLAFASPAVAIAPPTPAPPDSSHPDTVWFFVYLLDVDDIDASEQSFAANVYIGLFWKDERLAKEGSPERIIPLHEVWHPTSLVVNEVGLVRRSLPEVVEVLADGTVAYRQRYVGRFSQELLLSDFPLDEHDFKIQILFPKYNADELNLIPGTSPRVPGFVGGAIAEGFSLPDWHVLRFVVEEHPMRIGDTDVFAAGFALTFTARRYFTFYFWQVITPLVLIVMMSWAAFWIDPSEPGPQFGLAASSILTLIAYRFLLANLLPKLPYMTRMDYFSLFSTLLVFFALVEVMTTSALAGSDRLKLAKRIDLVSRFMFPVAFVGAAAWSFLC